MADTTITARLKLLAEGFKEAVKDSGSINNNLQNAAGAAQAINRTNASSSARGGASSAAPASMSNTEYSTSRGVTGGTGASARDFAKQARDIDGLVRIYATFAANLYAVGAAFRALSEAAATENLIKGLDSLGASSGRNLGFLSKQLVAATDGAISLREAMTTVAAASSAGLGSTQIKDIALVATKASQALGVNMSDAISRLSRGITKIEPELLDELGIFVKVDEATNKYALSVGKTVNSLSDFEKRQAFANAVVEEGKNKFASIETVTNPYDKLLASVSNLSTEGLVLVNKVLGPITSMLAESPTALMGIFTAIGGILLKQAVPALGAWRESLTKAAEESAKNAKHIRDAFMEYSIEKDLREEAKKVKPIQDKINSQVADAQTILAKTLSSKSKVLAQAMSGSLDSESMVKSLDTELKRRTTQLQKTQELQKAEGDKGSSADKDKLDAYNKLLSKQQEELANIRAANDLYKDNARHFAEIQRIQAEVENKPVKTFSGEWMRGKIAEYAEISATSKKILAGVGSDTETKGAVAAFKNLKDSIKNGIPALDEFGNVAIDAEGKIIRTTKGLTGLSAVTTGLKGSFLILGSSIGTALTALAPYLELLALAIAAYGFLDSKLSGAAKQQEEFNSKVEGTESAVKTAKDTITLYTEKTKEAFNIAAISAYTNALSGVSDALKDQISAFKEYKKSANIWDDLKDGLASVFGKSNLDKLQKNAIDSIKAVMDTLDYSSSAKGDRAALVTAVFGDKAQAKDLLASTKDLEKAFEGLSGAQREEKVKRIAAAIEKIKTAEEYSTNAAKAFIESLSNIDKLADQIIQANAFSDLQGKLGVELVQASQKFAQALMDPLKALTDIAALGKDPKALSALGMSLTEDLKQAILLEQQLNELSKARKAATETKELAAGGKGIKVTEERQAFTSAVLSSSSLPGVGLVQKAFAAGNFITNYFKAKREDVAEADKNLKEISSKIQDLQKKAAEFASSQITLVTQIAQAGFDKVEIGLKRAKEQAQIGVARTALSIAAGAGAPTAEKEYQLKIRELDIQKSLVEANYNVQLATIANTQAIEEFTLTMQQAEVARMKVSGTPDEREYAKRLEPGLMERRQIIDASKSGMTKEDISRYLGAKIGLAVEARRNETLIPKKQAEAALAGLQGQAQSALLEKQAKLIDEKNKKDQVALDLANQKSANLIEQVNLAAQLGVASTDSLVADKQRAQIDIINRDATKKRDDAEANYAKAKVASLVISKEDLKVLEATRDKTLELIQAEQDTKTLAVKIASINETTSVAIARGAKEYEQIAESKKLETSLTLANLDAEQKALDIRGQLGTISAEYAISRKAEIEAQRESLRYDEERARLEEETRKKREQKTAAESVVTEASRLAVGTPAGSIQQQNLSQAQESQKAAETAYNIALKAQLAAETLSGINKKNIEDTKNLNLELNRQTELFNTISTLTTSLSAVFGTLGESIGKFADALARAGAQGENNAKALEDNRKLQEDLIKQQDKGYDVADKLNDAKKDGAAISKKAAKDELSAQIQVIGASKKLFGEKTAAFKVLGVMEQAAHIKSIALSLKEAAIKSGLLKEEQVEEIAAYAKSLALKASEALKSIGIDIPAIYAKFMATLGPWGMAAASAAIAAFIGGSFGGGNKSVFVPDAKQQQEVQGTAMGYDAQGNKVQTSRGVFGDTEAKSESIAKSLEEIKTTSVVGLSYDNKVVELLGKINDGINGSAKTLYQIQGLRSGSMFGTVEGTSGGGLLSGIFGGKTTKEITDSGLLIKGSFADLAKTTNTAVIDFFEQIKTTTSGGLLGGLFGGGGSSSSKVVKEIDNTVSTFFSDVFSSAKDLFIQIGKSANLGETAVNAVLESVNFDQTISTRGLKGEELAKELSSVVGSMLDEAALQLFGSFEKYSKFGEGMLQTVIRVSDTNAKVRQQLENLGSSSTQLSALSYDVTEALVTAAGGVQEFLDQSKSFAESFLSESQQLAAYENAVTKTFNGLQLQVPKTKEDFVLLVQSLDLSSQAGRDTYSVLMQVAPAFDKIATAAQTTQNNLTTLKRRILELTGTSAELTAFDRAQTASTLDPSLLAAQNYVWALEDLKAAEDALAKARQAEAQTVTDQINSTKSTISSLKGYIDNLKKLRESLLLNDSLSPLTPSQKYSEAKSEFERLYALAMGPAKTEEEKAAKSAALSQLDSAASTFLTISRSYFAGSEQYNKDFTAVTDAIKNTESSLTSQLSTEEKSLATLESQLNSLNTVNDSVLSVREAILALEAAQAKASSAAADYNTSSGNQGLQYTSQGGAYIQNGKVYGNQGSSLTLEAAKTSIADYMSMVASGTEGTSVEALYNVLKNQWGLDSKAVAYILGTSQQKVLGYFTGAGLPAFAKGTNYVPEDMLANIHKGERIIPAADNENLMRALNSRPSNDAALVEELQKLNKKIESLEKTIAEGDLMNAQATERNTQQVSKTVQDTGSISNYKDTVRRRAVVA